MRKPRAQLDGCPVVVRSSERNEHGTSMRARTPGNEQRDVAWRLRKEDREILVGRAFVQEAVGDGSEQQLCVELGRETWKLTDWGRCRERRCTRHDAPTRELRT